MWLSKPKSVGETRWSSIACSESVLIVLTIELLKKFSCLTSFPALHMSIPSHNMSNAFNTILNKIWLLVIAEYDFIQARMRPIPSQYIFVETFINWTVFVVKAFDCIIQRSPEPVSFHFNSISMATTCYWAIIWLLHIHSYVCQQNARIFPIRHPSRLPQSLLDVICPGCLRNCYPNPPKVYWEWTLCIYWIEHSM
jgi:hypothetical protein